MKTGSKIQKYTCVMYLSKKGRNYLNNPGVDGRYDSVQHSEPMVLCFIEDVSHLTQPLIHLTLCLSPFFPVLFARVDSRTKSTTRGVKWTSVGEWRVTSYATCMASEIFYFARILRHTPYP